MAAVARDDDERIAYIRTTDRSLFKRCRRKWGFQSALRMNRDQIDRPGYFWIGTGGHFALEDYHGYNYYGHPVEAYKAYVDAQKKWSKKSRQNLPNDWEELAELGEALLDNYVLWLSHRDPLNTLWLDGEPQVECKILLELPWERGRHGWDRVIYQGTLDRVVEIDGELWVLDWKFYKTIGSNNLDFDQQMSSYIWLGSTVFDRPMAGAVLVQLRKTVPNEPKILSSGKLSTAGNQGTTHGLYKNALIEIYGSANKAPRQNIVCLNDLAARESGDRDDFVRRDKTRRTMKQQESEGSRIMMEIEDMLNPDLPLYTNPTRDCGWDCQMQDVCLMMDRDDHWQDFMQEITVSRETETEDWREYLRT